MRASTLCLIWAICMVGPAQAAVQLSFDYTYDSYGFFDDPLRRDALEAAGRFVNRYTDDLEAILPTDTNGWVSWFDKPDGSGTTLLRDLPVPADTMQIYVAGRPLPGRLAQSEGAPPAATPINQDDPNWDADWYSTVTYRGQLGAADFPATDFGPTGGWISFNDDLEEVPWHFGISTRELNANEFDFITVAMHELLHLMGIGISKSFANHVNSAGEFIGSQSVLVGSETNPNLTLDEFEAHWVSGTKSPWNGVQQEALLAPGIFRGKRAFPTSLDRAALRDIGWEEATAGDANRDRFFDSTDLIEVFRAGLYETKQFAGWSDGDWDDNAVFDTGDLVLALQTGTYEQAPASAEAADRVSADVSRVTVTYDSSSGNLRIASSQHALTGLQITSAGALFLPGNALELTGPFDVDRSDKLFVMRLDGFSDLDLGPVLPHDLPLPDLIGDLTIKGALLGGGALEPWQVHVVPEPCGCLVSALFMLGVISRRRIYRKRNRPTRL